MTRYIHILIRIAGALMVLALLIAGANQIDTRLGAIDAFSKANDASTSYLPIIRKNFPPYPTTFGSEFVTSATNTVISLAVEAGNYWVRTSHFNWNQIEATPGVYNWSSVDEASINNIHYSGMKIIAVVKKVPGWAQHPRGSTCGPIDTSAFDDFAAFLTATVNRYKGSIKYWELGNEPDIDPSIMIPGVDIYGCWGDESDPYYGGRYYADMLKVAYPAIKAADPSAQVLIGGLLLDCDPTNPPPGKTCLPSKFFEGILVGGGANYFDIVSFHGYPGYYGDLSNDHNFPSWNARGGVVLGKINFLKEVMQAYGIHKPIMHTEGGLLCHPAFAGCDNPGADFFEAQADYIPRLFLRNWAEGLTGTIWYTFTEGGWRFSGLLGQGNLPRPAYHAYSFMTSITRNATYDSKIDGYQGNPNIQGYRFAKPDRYIWAFWTHDETDTSLTLPPGTLQVYDNYGNLVTPVNGTVVVGSPIYLEIQR